MRHIPRGIVGCWLGTFALTLLVSAPAQADPKPAQPKPAAKKVQPNPLKQIEDDPQLPRVLLIGDSISIGYTLPVRQLLAGKANVHRPPTNCASTRTGLKHLDRWLGDKKWDVIHFNWGLHDLKHVQPGSDTIQALGTPGTGHQVPPEEYEQNLRELAARLKATGAVLIWRNTTPIPAGSKGRVVEDAPRYNAIAAKVMEQAGIPTHDLYGFVLPQSDKLMLKADVHFTNAGSEALARDVAAQIEAALATRKPQP